MKKKIQSKYSKNKNCPQTVIDNEVIKLFKNSRLQHLIIIILFKNKKIPQYCTPMLRHPIPKINIPINNNLEEIYFSAIKNNPAIEDGAILIQINNGIPILRGFSYRIYPPPLNVQQLKNMGSGYNSSLDFSGVKRVVCVYFINKYRIKKIVNGKILNLIKI